MELLGTLCLNKEYVIKLAHSPDELVELLLTKHCYVTIFWQIAFTRKKDFGKEDRELKWAQAQRTLHGLPEMQKGERSNHNELNQIAEEAKRRADMAR